MDRLPRHRIGKQGTSSHSTSRGTRGRYWGKMSRERRHSIVSDDVACETIVMVSRTKSPTRDSGEASLDSYSWAFRWSRWADSNRRPAVYETAALPTELHRHRQKTSRSIAPLTFKSVPQFCPQRPPIFCHLMLPNPLSIMFPCQKLRLEPPPAGSGTGRQIGNSVHHWENVCSPVFVRVLISFC